MAVKQALLAFPVALAVSVAASSVALADQGGVEFWLPGEFGSFAAAPGQPGFSVAGFYYHPSVTASANKTFQIGKQFGVGIEGRGDLFGFGPSYTFATPVLGGQAAVSLLAVGGRNWASVAATLTGPLGNQISGTKSQSLTSIGDLFPQATLKWNQGVNNYMIYATGDIPVGDYDANRLANLGLGHGAIDGGVGYPISTPQIVWNFRRSLGSLTISRTRQRNIRMVSTPISTGAHPIS